jgi:hypothetical protein
MLFLAAGMFKDSHQFVARVIKRSGIFLPNEL